LYGYDKLGQCHGEKLCCSWGRRDTKRCIPALCRG